MTSESHGTHDLNIALGAPADNPPMVSEERLREIVTSRIRSALTSGGAVDREAVLEEAAKVAEREAEAQALTHKAAVELADPARRLKTTRCSRTRIIATNAAGYGSGR